MVQFPLGEEVGYEDLRRQQSNIVKELIDICPLKEKEDNKKAEVSDEEELIEERRVHEFLRQELVIDLLHLNELPLKIVAHR